MIFSSSDAVGDIFLHDLLRFFMVSNFSGLATCDKAIVAQPHQLDTGHSQVKIEIYKVMIPRWVVYKPM